MLHYRFVSGPAGLTAVVHGLVSVEAWDAVLQQMQRELAQRPQEKVLLLDLLGVVGILGNPERVAIGTLMAERLAGLRRVALLVEPHKVTRVVQGEAWRRGLDLRVFSSLPEAQAWLTEPA